MILEKNVKFIVDDILNTNFNDNEFDYIFDRGCFHVLSSANRQIYIRKIKSILKANGIPYKFSEDEIRDLFSESFRIDRIKETVYQGTLNPLPKALFVVMINQG